MPPLRTGEDFPQMTELLVYEGTVAEGQEIFVTAQCATCHIVDDVGTNFGPDLSEIGAKLSKQGLYEAILDPSAGVSPTYQSYSLELDDGEFVTGFIESETPARVVLRMAGGVVDEFETSRIENRLANNLSPMPIGLQQTMSTGELIDLVAYLASLK